MKPLDISNSAEWKQRFRAPVVVYSSIAPRNPARGIVATNITGVHQIYAWDTVTGERHQRTDIPSGKVGGGISPDGKYIYYLQDEGGNEIGHYVRVPFEGGEPEDITPDLPPYSSLSISQSLDGSTIGFSAATQKGFEMYTIPVGEDSAHGKPSLLYRSARLSMGPFLSFDARYAAIITTERSEHMDFALYVFDMNDLDGNVRVLQEPEGSIRPVGFSPVPGDTRLLVITDASGYDRPLIFDVATGDQTDIPLTGTQGNITPTGWSPDGKKILLTRLLKAEYKLLVYDLETSVLTELDHPGGTLYSAYFMPKTDDLHASDTIYVNLSQSTNPTRVIALDAETGQLKETVMAAGEVPESRPMRSVTFTSSGNTEIQAWLATPEGAGPWPTILHTHGGPTTVQTDGFSAAAQAFIDHGFAFFSVNYRGSTTFGREFEQSIYGMLGHREVDDMAAGVQWLVDNDIAQPDAIILNGGSYGGYLTLQALGKRPDLWAGGIAVVAIADWVLMYEDQAETLRGYQRSLFGGTPEEKPEVHKSGSPITYAEDVAAPVLVIQGENDTRCPSRQMKVYEQKMRDNGKDIEIEWFDAGHGSLSVDQNIQHMEKMLHWLYRVLG